MGQCSIKFGHHPGDGPSEYEEAITEGVLAGDDFAGVVTPSQRAADFSSDWGYAKGKSALALTDNDTWTGLDNAGGDSRIEVVSASTLGFPNGMDNLFRVSYHGSKDSLECVGEVEIGSSDDLWPTPTGTQTVFMRAYQRVDFRDSIGPLYAGSHHPWQTATGDSCAQHWTIHFSSEDDGTTTIKFHSGGSTGDPWFQMWSSAQLDKFVANLIEVAFTRVNATTKTIKIRLNGVDRTDDFSATGYSTLDGAQLTISDACVHSSLYIGNNDPIGPASCAVGAWRDATWCDPKGPDPDQDFIYWGGIAVDVRDNANDWIGPWGNIIGESVS